ncbi:nuclear transport factor 2 family protein [Antrihabitans stalactiti]|uniref:Nuclear transport factor 2 family protein n=1 Tax=Antrihabitans stalactiti TaxID=2584121 RepID=A0A848KFQ4_9NOCA|nr:nuclear transport factor 2 family protein [Antrihabitans stalactiti]NMN95040.1 nuclear transport factor 2 family protein [Antrihabitans stalactiti]
MFDVATLRRSIEERDAANLIDLYADDAELELVDHLNPPSKPRVLRGRAEIADYLTDVCSRDMTHRIEHLISEDNMVAFTERCEYPSGSRVLCSAILHIADGRIGREVGVQVWDE